MSRRAGSRTDRSSTRDTIPPVRVIHVITGLGVGGAERLLVDHLQHTRHEARVISLVPGGAFAQQIRELGIPVIELSMNGNRDIQAVFRLAHLIRAAQPDVVHVHLYRALLFGRVSARIAGVRAIIATEHSAQANETERRPATAPVKVLYRFAELMGQLTIAVSAETKRILEQHWGIPAGRIAVVPNAVDVQRLRAWLPERDNERRRLGMTPDDVVVVTVGRLAPGKHTDKVVDAIAELLQRTTESWRLVIVGDGVDREQVDRAVSRHGLGSRITILGELENVAPILAAADVYVSASTAETFGISYLEAYCMGLPLVYRTGPSIEVIDQVSPEVRTVHVGESDSLAEGIVKARELGRDTRPLPSEAMNIIDITGFARNVDQLEESVIPTRSPAGWVVELTHDHQMKD